MTHMIFTDLHLPAGTYRVLGSKDGYDPYEEEVILDDNKEVSY